MAERYRAEHDAAVRDRFDDALAALGVALDRWYQAGDRSGFQAWLQEYGGMTEAEVTAELEGGFDGDDPRAVSAGDSDAALRDAGNHLGG